MHTTTRSRAPHGNTDARDDVPRSAMTTTTIDVTMIATRMRKDRRESSTGDANVRPRRGYRQRLISATCCLPPPPSILLVPLRRNISPRVSRGARGFRQNLKNSLARARAHFSTLDLLVLLARIGATIAEGAVDDVDRGRFATSGNERRRSR